MLKLIVAAIAMLGLGVALAVGAVVWERPAEGAPFRTPEATDADLERVAASKVFFGHKSVGFNILDALPSVYESEGAAAPTVVESTEPPSAPALVHTEIGENGDPLGKIANFDRIMREGMADAVDVAVLKLCYVDLRSGEVDVDEVFTAYRDTLAALSRDYPDTAFVAVTSPLTQERGPRAKLNAAIGRADRYGPEHNALRERFNTLVRAEYTEPGALFDLAAVQSTDASGERVAYSRDGMTYYSMDDDYAKDPGHLNSSGGAVAASALVAVLAQALD
ncbi:hypothetical protein EXE58_03505 [Nocardioides seonyuensis]|uniref:SGNH/GDSL hydrolase family protein n=1 Tax=Nocardioides seonyuensis TaxID=2518371 RepID=A0A4P7IC35_9ACTN|nr:hypothetical protein [Nocardioides seonyuensis]QBX54626.1 hypothetical protein EXE58_03505 [Nocardioides seonyuensis]